MKYIYYIERNVFLSCDFRENNQYFNKHENAIAEIFINKKYFSGIKGNFILSGYNVFLPKKYSHIASVFKNGFPLYDLEYAIFKILW